jgi:hypothetical protein
VGGNTGAGGASASGTGGHEGTGAANGAGGGGTTGAPGSKGGCHCRMSRGEQGTQAAGLLALSFLIARRRRLNRAS